MGGILQRILIEDKTSPGVLAPTEKKLLIEALQLQAKNDFNTSPWVEHGYCKPIEVLPWNEKTPPPVNSWNLILLDRLPEGNEEALGYHEDVEGGKIPVSYVGVKEARESDTPISEVASHELVEMAVNPHVETVKEMRLARDYSKEFVVEPCDPVESAGYIINNQLVSNFVWPLYYSFAQTRKSLCQKPNLEIDGPFTLSKYGYYSWRPIDSEREFQQSFGEKRTELPKWASRLPKIQGAK